MLWSFFAAYHLSAGLAPRITSWVATILVVFLASKFSESQSLKESAILGLVWACMHLLFDALYVTPSTGLIAFTTYFPWINYAIVFAVPSLAFVIGKIKPTQEIPSVSAP